MLTFYREYARVWSDPSPFFLLIPFLVYLPSYVTRCFLHAWDLPSCKVPYFLGEWGFPAMKQDKVKYCHLFTKVTVFYQTFRFSSWISSIRIWSYRIGEYVNHQQCRCYNNEISTKMALSLNTFFIRILCKLNSSWFSKFCRSLTLRPESSSPINFLISLKQ